MAQNNKDKVEPVLHGIVPPLVTPLTRRSELDSDSFAGLINRVIDGGVHGIFVLGSTGEFCSLSSDLRKKVVTEACATAAKRVPVVVNVSETSVTESLNLSEYAAGAGAAAVAICPPYYFSVTQSDLARYVRAFAEKSPLPVFLYNIPQNAHHEFDVETVESLAKSPNIVGLKNSNGSVDYIAQTSRIKERKPDFSILVGTEEILLPAMDAGADGSVCGGANMFPELYVKLYHAIREDRRSQAREMQELVVRIAEAVYTVGPPTTSYFRGLKGVLALLGVCGETLAEPFAAFDKEEKQELRSRLNRLLPEIE